MKLSCLAAAVLAGLLFPQLTSAQIAAVPMTRIVRPDTPQNVRLVAAVEAADLAAVQEALRSGASADTQTGWEAPAGLVHPPLMPITALPSLSASDHSDKSLLIFRLLIQNAGASSITNPKIAPFLLYRAVQKDDLDSVKSLTVRGININLQYPNASGILNASIEQSGTTVKTLSPVTKFLLDHGALVNATDTEGMTPLMNAAQYDKAEVVQALLARGADLTLRDKRGQTALDRASQMGQDVVVALLRGCSPMDIYEAAQFGSVARLRAHLDAGEDPNALKVPFMTSSGRDIPAPKLGMTPLMEAMKSGSLETVRLLLDRGADVNRAGGNGVTALHLAASYGDSPLAALLLDRGANINAAAGPQSRFATPLLYAVQQARVNTVALLLERGMDLKHGQGEAALEQAIRLVGNGLVRRRDVAGSHTLYGDAVYEARQQMIDLLLEAGVEVRSKSSHVLYLAANDGQVSYIDLFLRKGADVNGRGALGPVGSMNNGETALMGAVNAWSGAYGDEELLKNGTLTGLDLKDIRLSEQFARKSVLLLLSHGADVNLADAYGTTPLMLCATDGLPTLAKLLLAHGANADAVGPAGQTPLMQAAQDDNSALAALLLAHGANVNRHNAEGRTALMLAIDDGTNDSVRNGFANDDDSSTSDGKPQAALQKDLPNPNGHPKTVRLLLRAGAAVNAAAPNGDTALSLARKQGFSSVVALLVKAGARH